MSCILIAVLCEAAQLSLTHSWAGVTAKLNGKKLKLNLHDAKSDGGGIFGRTFGMVLETILKSQTGWLCHEIS